jgi:hypothetical protein
MGKQDRILDWDKAWGMDVFDSVNFDGLQQLV